MCRVWGISYAADAKEPISPSTLAMEMFPKLVTGGPDAWGFATWDGNSIQSAKFQGKANKSKAKQRMYAIDDDAKWIIGHTRAETHGSANHDYNNHPIVHGNVIGVHNGLITNHDDILRAIGRQDPKASVDSEAIFAAVNLLGYSGLNLVEGSMVSVWANRQVPQEVWLARSRSSELYVASTEQGSLMWCTEKQPLVDCSIPLDDEPEKITQTGVAFKVTYGHVSDPMVYNPNIKETGGFSSASTMGYGSQGYQYGASSASSSSGSTTPKPAHIPTLKPGRNPIGTIRKAREAAKAINAATIREKESVQALHNLGEIGEDDMPISGITDFFDSGRKESRQATKVLPPNNSIQTCED